MNEPFPYSKKRSRGWVWRHSPDRLDCRLLEGRRREYPLCFILFPYIFFLSSPSSRTIFFFFFIPSLNFTPFLYDYDDDDCIFATKNERCYLYHNHLSSRVVKRTKKLSSFLSLSFFFFFLWQTKKKNDEEELRNSPRNRWPLDRVEHRHYRRYNPLFGVSVCPACLNACVVVQPLNGSSS